MSALQAHFDETYQWARRLCVEVTGAVPLDELQEISFRLGLDVSGSQEDLCGRISEVLRFDLGNLAEEPSGFHEDLSVVMDTSVRHKRQREELGQLPPAQRKKLDALIDYTMLLPDEIVLEVMDYLSVNALNHLALLNVRYRKLVERAMEQRRKTLYSGQCKGLTDSECNDVFLRAVQTRDTKFLRQFFRLGKSPAILRRVIATRLIHQDTEIMRIILEETGIDPNIMINRQPLVWIAATSGKPELMKLLLVHGASPTIPAGELPVTAFESLDNILWLLGVGGKMSSSTLASAPYRLTPDQFKTLLKFVDVNSQDAKGSTPLHHAMHIEDGQKRFSVVKALLQAGANPNIADNSGQTPLMEEIRRTASPWYGSHDENRDVIALLREWGADPNLQDAQGQTAVMHAIADKRVLLLKQLIKGGPRRVPIDLNVQDNDGDTALLIAKRAGLERQAAALLAAGADPHIPNKIGETALDH